MCKCSDVELAVWGLAGGLAGWWLAQQVGISMPLGASSGAVAAILYKRRAEDRQPRRP